MVENWVHVQCQQWEQWTCASVSILYTTTLWRLTLLLSVVSRMRRGCEPFPTIHAGDSKRDESRLARSRDRPLSGSDIDACVSSMGQPIGYQPSLCDRP